MNFTKITGPAVLTVSQLTQAIKFQLEKAFPTVWLKGEISNLKIQSPSGHAYFSLKDEWSQISAVMFRLDLQKVPFPIKAGDQILVRGEINVFPPKGNYQLIIREISLIGLGDQLVKLEMLKKKLEARGWFTASRKRPLPRFPKSIGVVTSPTGAVIQDIINVLTRRFAGFHLILNPVRVQGEGAEKEIAQAIAQFNQHSLVDVLIVARGGGSFEDLTPFNTEIVAQAIVESTIPVVSAIGHETDFSIADFVADLRAPTPSAAAEIVSQEAGQLLETLMSHHKRMHNSMTQLLFAKKQGLKAILKQPAFVSPSYLLGSFAQILDDKKDLLKAAIEEKMVQATMHLFQAKKRLEVLAPWMIIKENKNRLFRIEKNLHASGLRLIAQKKERLVRPNDAINSYWKNIVLTKKKNLSQLTNHLASLNPKSLLQKGYSILFSQKTGSVITSVKSTQINEAVKIVLQDGNLEATIHHITESHETAK